MRRDDRRPRRDGDRPPRRDRDGDRPPRRDRDGDRPPRRDRDGGRDQRIEVPRAVNPRVKKAPPKAAPAPAPEEIPVPEQAVEAPVAENTTETLQTTKEE
jgi:hypothetical protein